MSFKFGDRVRVVVMSVSFEGIVFAIDGCSPTKEVCVAIDSSANTGFAINQAVFDHWGKHGYGYKYSADHAKYHGKYGVWRYIGDAVLIKPAEVSPSPSLSASRDGTHCKVCKEFSPYANEGFTCYPCRQDPYRLSALRVDE